MCSGLLIPPQLLQSYYSFFMTYDVSDGLWDVQDVEYLRSRTFGMWNVRDVGCSGCGMFRVWDVGDVACSGCGMFGVWDVGCGMFVGMWDVDLQHASTKCGSDLQTFKHDVLKNLRLQISGISR